MKRRISQLTTGMLVFAAMGIAMMVSSSAALAANGTVETGKVFGEARLVPDADKGAMALCLEGERLYVGAGPWLHVYDGLLRARATRRTAASGGVFRFLRRSPATPILRFPESPVRTAAAWCSRTGSTAAPRCTTSRMLTSRAC